MNLSLNLMSFALNLMNFVLWMDNTSVLKNDEICRSSGTPSCFCRLACHCCARPNNELCLQTDEFRITNAGFCIQNDQLCRCILFTIYMAVLATSVKDANRLNSTQLETATMWEAR